MPRASTATRSLTAWLAVPGSAQILAAVAIPWLPNKSLVIVAVGAALAITFAGWGAYAVMRTRDLRRLRREAEVSRAQGEATLRRFAESLTARG